MLTKAIKYFIAGLVLPYLGMWFAQNFMLGTGAEPNFLPWQIASGFTFFLSVGLYYLSLIEKRLYLRYFGFSVAAIYGVMHFGILLPSGSYQHHIWFNAIYFLKVLTGALAGFILLGLVKEIQNEI